MNIKTVEGSKRQTEWLKHVTFSEFALNAFNFTNLVFLLSLTFSRLTLHVERQ